MTFSVFIAALAPAVPWPWSTSSLLFFMWQVLLYSTVCIVLLWQLICESLYCWMIYTVNRVMLCRNTNHICLCGSVCAQTALCHTFSHNCHNFGGGVIDCHQHCRYCSSCLDGHLFFIHLCHFCYVGSFMGPVSKQSNLHAFGTQNADAPNLPLRDWVWTWNTNCRRSRMPVFLRMLSLY